MAQGICPGCGERREIVPKGQIKEGFSSRWWEVVVHKHPEKAEICRGSGKRI